MAPMMPTPEDAVPCSDCGHAESDHVPGWGSCGVAFCKCVRDLCVCGHGQLVHQHPTDRADGVPEFGSCFWPLRPVMDKQTGCACAKFRQVVKQPVSDLEIS